MTRKKDLLHSFNNQLKNQLDYLDTVIEDEEVAKAEVAKAKAELNKIRRLKNQQKRSVKETEEIIEALSK